MIHEVLFCTCDNTSCFEQSVYNISTVLTWRHKVRNYSLHQAAFWKVSVKSRTYFPKVGNYFQNLHRTSRNYLFEIHDFCHLGNCQTRSPSEMQDCAQRVWNAWAWSPWPDFGGGLSFQSGRRRYTNVYDNILLESLQGSASFCKVGCSSPCPIRCYPFRAVWRCMQNQTRWKDGRYLHEPTIV